MELNRVLADAEQLGDAPVRLSRCHQAQDFEFTRRQRLGRDCAVAFDACPQRSRIEHHEILRRRPHRRLQLGRRCIDRQVRVAAVPGRWLRRPQDDRWHIDERTHRPTRLRAVVNHDIEVGADRLVVAAWFTAAENKPLVQFVISKDSGKSFSEPVEIPSRQAIGRVDIAIIDPTSFAVSWLDTDRKGTYAINIRGLTVDGQAGPTHTVGRTGVMHSVPQLVRVADDLVLAWPDKIGDSSKVYAIKVPIR